MSWSLTKVVGLVIIPLMIASAILASLNSIQTRTIDPKGEDANQKVKNYGRTVTVGNNAEDEEAAAEQLKGAMILSQASAWNCAMLPVILDGRMTGDADLSGAQGNSRADYHIYGRSTGDDHKLFMYLYRSKAVPSCTGASEVNLPSVDISLPSIGDVVNMVTLIDDYEDIAAFMTCQVMTSMEKQNGQDMEGVYGRINLDFSMNTKLGRDTNHRLWNINIKDDDDGCWAQDADREIQHLWKGQDVSQYLPYPKVDLPYKRKVERETGGIEALKNLYTGGSGDSVIGELGVENENYDSGGVLNQVGDPGTSLSGEVIIDAPLVIPGGPTSDSNLPWKIRNGYYLFCKNAEGFIQTNTIGPGYEQESTKQSTETLFGTSVEDYTGASSVTYTYVMITENRKSCFDEVGVDDNAQQLTMNGETIEYYLED